MNRANEEYAGIRASIDGLKAEVEKVSALQELHLTGWKLNYNFLWIW